MKFGVILGIVSILVFVTALFFTIKTFQSSLTGNVVTVDASQDSGDVVVKNGVQEVVLSYKKYPEGYKFNYYPEVIEVKKDMPVKIIGDKSLTGCYTSFNIPDLGIKHSFLANPVLEFTPQKTGTFSFSCAMAMGGGKLVVS